MQNAPIRLDLDESDDEAQVSEVISARGLARSAAASTSTKSNRKKRARTSLTTPDDEDGWISTNVQHHVDTPKRATKRRKIKEVSEDEFDDYEDPDDEDDYKDNGPSLSDDGESDVDIVNSDDMDEADFDKELEAQQRTPPKRKLTRLKKSSDVHLDLDDTAEIELELSDEETPTTPAQFKPRSLHELSNFIFTPETKKTDTTVYSTAGRPVRATVQTRALRSKDPDWAPAKRRRDEEEEDEFAGFIVDEREIVDDEGSESEDELMAAARQLKSNSRAHAKSEASGELLNGRSVQKQKVVPKRQEIFEHGFDEVIGRCEELANTLRAIVESKAQIQEVTEAQPKSLLHDLKDYQLKAINWLYTLKGQKLSGILGDEMGLGKTIQTIGLMALLHDKGEMKPSLIVVPASTLHNWERELAKWCPDLNAITYYGNQKERAELQSEIKDNFRRFKKATAASQQGVAPKDRKIKVVLTTYQVAQGKIDRSFFRKYEFSYLVLDEAHSVKNAKSMRYKQLTAVDAQYRLLLTGTPLQNNLEELWALLHFLMPKFFELTGNEKKVFAELVRLKKTDRDAAAEMELEMVERMKKALTPFFLRRTKAQAGLKLLPKTSRALKCSLTASQRETYNEVFAQSRKFWQEQQMDDRERKTGINLVLQNILMQLRKVANHPLLIRSYYTDSKVAEIAAKIHATDLDVAHTPLNELIEDYQLYSDWELNKLAKAYTFLSEHRLTEDQLWNSSGKLVALKSLLPKLQSEGKRVLLFSQMTKMLDILEPFLDSLGYKYLRLDGQTPVETRQGLIDKYNQDPSLFIFLLSTRAGGLGINLTSADTVIFYDICYNPQVDRQAEDRCHRMGQTKAVQVYKMITGNTCEEQIQLMAKEKRKLNDIVLEEGKHAKGKKGVDEDVMDGNAAMEILDGAYKSSTEIPSAAVADGFVEELEENEGEPAEVSDVGSDAASTTSV